MLLHTIGTVYAICVLHSLTHSDMLDSDGRTTAFIGDGDGGRGRRHDGAIAAWILLTTNSFSQAYKHNTCHARLTCTRI